MAKEGFKRKLTAILTEVHASEKIIV